jgi:hypothetical protein
MDTPRDPAISDDRFKRTVERIGAEAFWLRTYQAAIEGMRVTSIGLDFFRVALNALKDARLVRLIRVLENDSRTASFWYLRRTNAALIEGAAKRAGLDLVELEHIAGRFVAIRNKTFMHIDKDGVFDPQQFYAEAGITHAQVARTIEGLWVTMKDVHVSVFGSEPRHDVYTGEDIRTLAALRDAAA